MKLIDKPSNYEMLVWARSYGEALAQRDKIIRAIKDLPLWKKLLLKWLMPSIIKSTK